MNQNLLKLSLVVIGLVAAATAFYYYRPLGPRSTKVAVTGESTSDLPPDNALISFSVSTQNAQAVSAQNENSRRAETVIKALEATCGGSGCKIETSAYNLNPQRDWSDGRERIIGYEARNTITVTTDKMDQVGTIMDAATKAGANEVSGVNFVLRDDSAKRGEALGVATRQAMAKAESIAASLGGRITRVVETIEGGASPSAAAMADQASDFRGAANSIAKPTVPIRPSSVTVRGSVTLTVEVTVSR